LDAATVLLNDGAWPAAVADRRVFYNNSFFDGNNPAANALDANAIAPGKAALLPGGTASEANYTNFSKGITGVMVDVANLPAGRTLSADDFAFRAGNTSSPGSWASAPTPAVTVTPNGGGSGVARVTLTWPDNLIRRTWLQVTVLATADTGLASPDVFYFGNLPGDTFNGGTAAAFPVNALDLQATRNAQFTAAPIGSAFDFNRTGGSVNSIDLQVARNGQFTSLVRLAAPAAAAATTAPAAAPTAAAPTAAVTAGVAAAAAGLFSRTVIAEAPASAYDDEDAPGALLT
jgi:hypothetical protein